MSIKIGDIDLIYQGINNEFRIKVLEEIMEFILQQDKNIKIPSKVINDIRNNAIKTLQTKYPNMGISTTSNKKEQNE